MTPNLDANSQAEGLNHTSPGATPWVAKPVIFVLQAEGLVHNPPALWNIVTLRHESRFQRSSCFLRTLNPGRCPWAGMNDAGRRRGNRPASGAGTSSALFLSVKSGRSVVNGLDFQGCKNWHGRGSNSNPNLIAEKGLTTDGTDFTDSGGRTVAARSSQDAAFVGVATSAPWSSGYRGMIPHVFKMRFVRSGCARLGFNDSQTIAWYSGMPRLFRALLGPRRAHPVARRQRFWTLCLIAYEKTSDPHSQPVAIYFFCVWRRDSN